MVAHDRATAKAFPHTGLNQSNMPKVAYLTGVPGAGKSFIAGQVMDQNLAQFFVGDEVWRRLIQIMCPNVRPLSVWSEELWDQLETHCNVQPAMEAEGISHKYSNFLRPEHQRIPPPVSVPKFSHPCPTARSPNGQACNSQFCVCIHGVPRCSTCVLGCLRTRLLQVQRHLCTVSLSQQC